MAEMGQATEVYAWRPVHVWRSLMDWVAFVVQIIAQIVRGTPSVAQFVLSHIGLTALPLPSLLASFSSSSPSFKPLPSVELSLDDSNASPHVCVDSCADEDNDHDDHHRVEKLTVSIYLVSFPFVYVHSWTWMRLICPGYL
jgi:RNA polymerase II subunit A small phosphatase-like protein